jgi:hypothetical protein
MIRFLKAFAWLRWRLLINNLKGSRRRDTMERLARVMALLVKVLLFLLPLGGALLFGALGMLGGWMVGTGSAPPAPVIFAARMSLLAVFIMLALIPLSAATQGGVTGYKRLLLLPISRHALHAVEVAASLADPWVVFILPGIVLFAGGLMLAGRAAASIIALAAAIGIIAVLASLGALISFLLSWLMRNRRRGELFTLVFVLVISVVGLLPAFVTDDLASRKREARAAGRQAETPTVERIDSALPVWSRAIPSELYGYAIRSGIDGRWGIAWLGVGGLLLEAAVLYGLSSAAHRKLIETAESEGGRRRGARMQNAGRRLPGLTPAASAVAWAQARTAFRSVRGRLIIFMPGPLIALLGVLSRRVPEALPGGSFLGSDGYVLLGAGIIFSLYALQAFSMNQFASDRAGLTLQFLSPIPDAELVKGKAAGCAIVLGATVLLCLVCSLIVAAGGSPLVWLSVLMGGAATYLLMSPFGAWMSALFPVASDLSKTGTGGNPHSLAFLLGTLLIFAFSSPAVLILALVYHRFQRPGLALLLMALWTLVAAVIAIPLLGLAARALAARRENLALVAQGR